MDDDWKANLRRSVEAARTAGAGKAVKATLLEEPRISRKEIEEALESSPGPSHPPCSSTRTTCPAMSS